MGSVSASSTSLDFVLQLVESPDVESGDMKGRPYYVFLYKGFEHTWILVSIGVLETIPWEYPGTTILIEPT